MTRVEPRCNEPVSNEVIGFIVTPVTAKHMKKNLVIGNKFPHSLGPSLHRGSTVYAKVQDLFRVQKTKNKPVFDYLLKICTISEPSLINGVEKELQE